MDKFTRKTLFEQWFSPISQTKLEELVGFHQLNYYTKKLHIASFLKLLLFVQLNETGSLRAVSETLYSDDLRKATDLESISFSQRGRRLNQVPTEIFQQVFLDLVAQIHKKSQYEQRRNTTTPLKIIDSSTLPLNLNNHKWAEFRKTKSGIKLHLRLVFAENAFRLLKVLDSKGNELHLITNRFDLSADEISELYKSRWAIELFFKWMKQH